MMRNITLALLCAIVFLSVEACSTGTSTAKYSHYQDAEVYEISNFELWLAGLDTINAEARTRGLRVQANGFWDPLRRELWCPKPEGTKSEKRGKFATCGFELLTAAGVIKPNEHWFP